MNKLKEVYLNQDDLSKDKFIERINAVLKELYRTLEDVHLNNVELRNELDELQAGFTEFVKDSQTDNNTDEEDWFN